MKLNESEQRIRGFDAIADWMGDETAGGRYLLTQRSDRTKNKGEKRIEYYGGLFRKGFAPRSLSNIFVTQTGTEVFIVNRENFQNIVGSQTNEKSKNNKNEDTNAPEPIPELPDENWVFVPLPLRKTSVLNDESPRSKKPVAQPRELLKHARA